MEESRKYFIKSIRFNKDNSDFWCGAAHPAVLANQDKIGSCELPNPIGSESVRIIGSCSEKDRLSLAIAL